MQKQVWYENYFYDRRYKEYFYDEIFHNRHAKMVELSVAPTGVDNWNGPYLKKKDIPTDPWGNAYHYRFPGENGDYDLYSLGADNADGGDGENADVVSW